MLCWRWTRFCSSLSRWQGNVQAGYLQVLSSSIGFAKREKARLTSVLTADVLLLSASPFIPTLNATPNMTVASQEGEKNVREPCPFCTPNQKPSLTEEFLQQAVGVSYRVVEYAVYLLFLCRASLHLAFICHQLDAIL